MNGPVSTIRKTRVFGIVGAEIQLFVHKTLVYALFIHLFA